MADNATIVRRFYDEVFSKGDLEVIDELLAADAVEHELSEDATGDARADLKTFVTSFRAGFPDLHVAVEDVLETDDRVAARVTMRGTNTGTFLGMPPTGATIELPVIDIMRIRDGLVVEHWGASDSAALLRQLQPA